MSTFGNYYKITTFGESHIHSVGVTINSHHLIILF